MKKILPIFILILTMAAAVSQDLGQRLILAYVQGSDFKVIGEDRSIRLLGSGIYPGDELRNGDTIVTGPFTSVELRLVPNSSIIKVGQKTTFEVKSLANTQDARNSFSLASGKIRSIVAKDTSYKVASKTAIASVRGTDFIVEANELETKVFVSSGDVLLEAPQETSNQSVDVPAGFAALPAADFFDVVPLVPETLIPAAEGLDFQNLDPSQVQGHEAATPLPMAAGLDTGKQSEVWEPTLVLGVEGGYMEEGSNYAYLAFAPELRTRYFKLGLFLPVIAPPDKLNFGNLYQPQGQNEWDFGSSQFSGSVGAGLGDMGRDLALKLRYLEIGDAKKDPVFLKVGNIEHLTFGYGFLVNDYSNNVEYPYYRNTGVLLGINTNVFGLSLFSSSVDENGFLAASIGLHPLGSDSFNISVTGVVDGTWLAYGQKVKTTKTIIDFSSSSHAPVAGRILKSELAADMGVKILDLDALSLEIFATGAGALDSANLPKWDWAAAGGVKGRAGAFELRAEYRYLTGLMVASKYDSMFELSRSIYAIDEAIIANNQIVSDYMGGAPISANVVTPTPAKMSVYGELGLYFFEDKLQVNAGYAYSWNVSEAIAAQPLVIDNTTAPPLMTTNRYASNYFLDQLHVAVNLDKGLIPALSASVGYDVLGFAKALSEGADFPAYTISRLQAGLSFNVLKKPSLDIFGVVNINHWLDPRLSVDYSYSSGRVYSLGVKFGL